jgi:hypothetical protein
MSLISCAVADKAMAADAAAKTSFANLFMFLLSGEISADKLRYKITTSKKLIISCVQVVTCPFAEGRAMNLAAILPQAGAISERCQIVQSTFLVLCCFLVTTCFFA